MLLALQVRSRAIAQPGAYTITTNQGEDGQMHVSLLNGKTGEETTLPKPGETLGMDGTLEFSLWGGNIKVDVTAVEGKVSAITIDDANGAKYQITQASNGDLSTASAATLDPSKFPTPTLVVKEAEDTQTDLNLAWLDANNQPVNWSALTAPPTTTTQPPPVDGPSGTDGPDGPEVATQEDKLAARDEKIKTFLRENFGEFLANNEGVVRFIGRLLDPDGDGELNAPLPTPGNAQLPGNTP